MNRKTILIYWPSRTFVEVIAPIIPDLTRAFNLVVMLNDHSTPEGTVSLLQSLEAEGAISKYYITPHHTKLFKNHQFMKRVTNELRGYSFDFWLTGSEMQVRERFLLHFVLPEHCTAVVMWQNITFLFMYSPGIVGKLLAGEYIPAYPAAREDVESKAGASGKDQTGSQRRRASDELIAQLKKILRPVLGGGWWRWRAARKHFRAFLDRVIFPWILTGQTFRLGPYDDITQIGSGRSEMLILFDGLEAKAHQNLFRQVEVVTAQYTTAGSCKCKPSSAAKEGVLSPLSNFVNRSSIPEEALSLYYRDFRTVLGRTGAEHLDLRVHPDETGRWPYQLCDFLRARDIDANLVKPDLPLRKVVCGYQAVAGSASASLRDCRAACDYVSVIAFVGVSRFQLRDPQFAFGDSEGIGWINAAGGYDPNIFGRNKHVPPKRKTVAGILNELSFKKGLTVVAGAPPVTRVTT